jgi:hypothetical protein
MGFVWRTRFQPQIEEELKRNSSKLSNLEIKGIIHYSMVHAWELDLQALREYIDSKEEHSRRSSQLL